MKPNRKAVAAFTPHRDGWVRWYKGRTRFVCGKTVPLDEVEDRWAEVKRAIDLEEARPIFINRGAGITLKDLAGRFLARQRRCLETGRPKKIEPHTFHDYVKTMELLRKAFGADCDVTQLGPADFNRLAKRFDSRAPSTLARNIAYIKAFFNWAAEADLIPDHPNYGPDFIKPTAQAKRDHRFTTKKSYTPDELCKLWQHAEGEVKCWLALGINCAFDNSDISNLTRDVVDLKRGVIDFRRRKMGKIRRVCPLHPQTIDLLQAYERPDAADEKYADLFFLAPNGLPLVRIQPHKSDPLKSTQIDAVNTRWKYLLSASGVRGKITTRTLPTGRVVAKYPKGDGRGFRSLRTTFSNLQPHSYRDEVEIVMGHSHGSVLLDNYLEEVGLDRLRELVMHVWSRAFTNSQQSGQSPHHRPEPSAPSS